MTVWTAIGARRVVAVLLTSGGRIKLLRRSDRVAHDRALWHCVTGYLPVGASPIAQAIDELHEETGLRPEDLTGLRVGPVLTLRGEVGDEWVVHTFTCEINAIDLTLNWEHDAQKWAHPAEVSSSDHVAWLADVVSAFPSAAWPSHWVHTDYTSIPPTVVGGARTSQRKA